MKKIILAIFAVSAVGFIAPAANATIVTATAITTTGTVMISSPSASNVTIIRGCRLCNDTAAALCVQMYKTSIAAANSLGMVCAAAQACSDTPHDAAPVGSPANGLGQFFGENFQTTGQFMVSSASATVAAAAGATFTCDYVKPVR